MPPRRPQALTAAGRRAWDEALATLVALGEDVELSTGTLERYARAAEQLDALERAWRTDGRPATAHGGATGSSTVVHPLLVAMERARAQAQALAEALGLDPAGRRKLSRPVGPGRPQGAASAADRAAPPRRRLRVAP